MIRPRIRPRGFTLVEVLVALVIVALGAAAVLTALRTAADSAARQRERMLAGLVAANRIVETRLEPEWPASGTRDGTAEMGGRRWLWRQEITRTPFDGVLQIRVSVRPDAEATGTPAAAATARARRSAADDAWTVTLTGARGRDLMLDPAYDRLWDLARREGG